MHACMHASELLSAAVLKGLEIGESHCYEGETRKRDFNGLFWSVCPALIDAVVHWSARVRLYILIHHRTAVFNS